MRLKKVVTIFVKWVLFIDHVFESITSGVHISLQKMRVHHSYQYSFSHTFFIRYKILFLTLSIPSPSSSYSNKETVRDSNITILFLEIPSFFHSRSHLFLPFFLPYSLSLSLFISPLSFLSRFRYLKTFKGMDWERKLQGNLKLVCDYFLPENLFISYSICYRTNVYFLLRGTQCKSIFSGMMMMMMQLDQTIEILDPSLISVCSLLPSPDFYSLVNLSVSTHFPFSSSTFFLLLSYVISAHYENLS